MPVHDWTCVPAGIFHHFHQQWMTAISNALNAGRLPPGYYALAEQIAGDMVPDVLTLEIEAPNGDGLVRAQAKYAGRPSQRRG
jgi:hypothetical protein